MDHLTKRERERENSEHNKGFLAPQSWSFHHAAMRKTVLRYPGQPQKDWVSAAQAVTIINLFLLGQLST